MICPECGAERPSWCGGAHLRTTAFGVKRACDNGIDKKPMSPDAAWLMFFKVPRDEWPAGVDRTVRPAPTGTWPVS